MNKRTAAAAISVSLIGGTALGASVLGPWAVGAQSTTSTTAAQSTPSTPDPATPAVPEDIEAEITERLSEQLQSLVDDGTITDAQRDAVVAKLVEGGPMGGFGGGHGHGPRGGGFGFLGGGDALAEALGMSEDELRQELTDGKSIADIATEQGVPVQTVVDALVAEATAKLDEAVTAGRLTQAQADGMKADITEHITALVNGEMPMPPMGDGDGRPFGPHGPRQGGSAPTTSTTGA